MGELRRSGTVPWAVVGVLAVMLVLYVGAYYATVEPVLAWSWPIRRIPVYQSPVGTSRVADWVEIVFKPIHEFDRRLRPHVWER